MESDMQKKYQQQLASTALKRGNSTAALVVKKEGTETVLKMDKVAKNLTVDDDITVGFATLFLTSVYQQILSGRHAKEVPAAVGKHSTEARKLLCVRRCEARSYLEEGGPAEGRTGGQASSRRGRDDCWGDAEDAG